MPLAETAPTQISGFVVLDKPAGVSSARVLNSVKRILPRGTKVGHAGTLDPFATGVLVVLVGDATKQSERVMTLAKGYVCTLRLGSTTPTFDPEGEATASHDGPPPERAAVEAILPQFVGTLQQVPPAHSAIKVGGRRSYDLARAGAAVELSPRTVRVDRLELMDYRPPDAVLSMTVGRGFYVRALARDVGEALGVGGHLTTLRRTFVGPFHERFAVRPEDVSQAALLPPEWLDATA